LSKFDEALKFIEKSSVCDQLIFEKAYCEYRLNKPEESLKTIESAKLNPLPANLKELKAQVYYRLEQFDDCFNLYRDIIKNTSDDYEEERTTNLSAVTANLSIAGTDKKLPEFSENTYELVYNSAVALSGDGKFGEAEKKLKLSEKMCREFLEEDESTTEEDIQNELAIIRVQLAYCLQKQGRNKEASLIYAEILKNKPTDPALIAVASNNSVVINKDQNVFDSKKKIRNALVDAVEHKLNCRQKKSIALNNCILALFTHQGDLVQLTNKLAVKYPDLEFKAGLIQAGQYAKDKKFKEASEALEKLVTKHPNAALEVRFALVQLHLSSGNKVKAIEVLQSLDNNTRFSPGVVSALVSLYLGNNDKQAASDTLKTAVDWYKKNKNDVGDLTDMWRHAADFHMRGGEAETAAKSLEELLRSNPSDMKILAQLVIAYAQFNPKKAQEVSKKLPALETLTTQAEIDELEATNWMMIAKAVKKKQAIKSDQSPGTPGSEGAQKKIRKRKRKNKLPKYFDPNVKPDPERWLPKQERTGYRKKKDRRVKEVMKGSQGMASGQADMYDMTKAQNLGQNVKATTREELTPGPRQHQRKHQGKKKKGKH
jgi:signal recognition particle subunit SRP72